MTSHPKFAYLQMIAYYMYTSQYPPKTIANGYNTILTEWLIGLKHGR